MNYSKTIRTYLTTALVLTVTLVTGCTSMVKAPTGLRAERKSGGGVHVQSVYLETSKNGLRVSGTVSRMIGYESSSRRHLDVEVTGADGAFITRTAVSFTPNPIRHNRHTLSRSAYAVTLPQVPPTGSVVHVTVHATSLADCRN